VNRDVQNYCGPQGDVEVSAIKGITFDIPRQRVSMSVRPSGVTLGFSDQANLDEAHMWPTAFALKELTAAEGMCCKEWRLARPLGWQRVRIEIHPIRPKMRSMNSFSARTLRFPNHRTCPFRIL